MSPKIPKQPWRSDSIRAARLEYRDELRSLPKINKRGRLVGRIVHGMKERNIWRFSVTAQQLVIKLCHLRSTSGGVYRTWQASQAEVGTGRTAARRVEQRTAKGTAESFRERFSEEVVVACCKKTKVEGNCIIFMEVQEKIITQTTCRYQLKKSGYLAEG
jgi:hypothetical protein